jgi:hypothetical protein
MIEGEVGAHFKGSNAFMSMPMCEALTTKIAILLVGPDALTVRTVDPFVGPRQGVQSGA